MNTDLTLTPFDSAPAGVPVPRSAPAVAQPAQAAHDIPLPHIGSNASETQIKAALQDINQRLAADNKQISLEYNRDITGVVIRVIDKRTQEVIRQMPSEEMLNLARRLSSSSGLLLREIA